MASVAFAQAKKETPAKAASVRPITPVVRVITPAPAEDLKADEVSIQYQANPQHNLPTRPARYRLQLDSQLPVETVETSYTFSSLPAGDHKVVVELLDSKQRPVKSSQAEVAFVTSPPEPASADLMMEPMMPPTLQKVAMFLPQPAAPIDPADGTAEMPLLSVIGLGVLVGGMVSAMKTRT